MNKIEKCDVTCSWTPSPVTNCHTFSDPLPLERDVLYGRPPMKGEELSELVGPNHKFQISTSPTRAKSREPAYKL